MINFDVFSHTRKVVAMPGTTMGTSKSQERLHTTGNQPRAKYQASAERASSSRAHLDRSILSKSVTDIGHKRTRTTGGVYGATTKSQLGLALSSQNHDFDTGSNNNMSRMSGRSLGSHSYSG